MKNIIVRENDALVDELEFALLHYPPAHTEIKSVFTKGLYSRAMYAKKGEDGAMAVLISMPHKTEHQFFLMQGKLSISIDNGEWKTYEAPYAGITLSGTRRVAVVHEDIIWVTVHPLGWINGNENDLPKDEFEKVVNKIEKILIEPMENKLITYKFNQICHS